MQEDADKTSKNTINQIRKGVEKVTGLLDEVFNKVISKAISALIATPFVDTLIEVLVLKHKWKIIGCVFMIPLILCGVMILLLGSVYSLIPADQRENTDNISTETFKKIAKFNAVPLELFGYIEEGFDSSTSPIRSPFGGSETQNIYITAGYRSESYKAQFGHDHLGMDIVPSTKYYNNNKAYKLISEPVMFATCSGTATGMVDGYGANYIYLECDDKIHSLLFVHNEVNYVKNIPTHVMAGEPIAIMGTTGYSTGEHIHYQVKNITTGETEDPLLHMEKFDLVENMTNL